MVALFQQLQSLGVFPPARHRRQQQVLLAASGHAPGARISVLAGEVVEGAGEEQLGWCGLSLVGQYKCYVMVDYLPHQFLIFSQGIGHRHKFCQYFQCLGVVFGLELDLCVEELLVHAYGYASELCEFRFFLGFLFGLVELHHIHDASAVDHA